MSTPAQPHETTVDPDRRPSSAGRDEPGTPTSGGAGSNRTAPPGQRPAEHADAALVRIEKRLEEIRGLLNALARERQHRDFSAALLVGVVVQIVAAGLIGMALLDWIFQAEPPALAVKLAFAAVFQLAALTALVAWRSRGSG